MAPGLAMSIDLLVSWSNTEVAQQLLELIATKYWTFMVKSTDFDDLLNFPLVPPLYCRFAFRVLSNMPYL